MVSHAIESAEEVLARIADRAAALEGSSPGGALLGPRLVIGAAGGVHDAERLARVGTAVELLRRATLVHRNPQVEEPWPGSGNTGLSGTLRGDMLFADSFRLLSEDGEPRLGTVLSRAMASVSEGELMFGAGSDQASRIHCSAAYYRGAAATGAILSGADDNRCESLADWGQAVGEAHERALLGESVIPLAATDAAPRDLCEWVLTAIGAPDRAP